MACARDNDLRAERAEKRLKSGDNSVQAIIVAIDQYAESATGNRDFFFKKPHSVGPKVRLE